MWRPRAAWQYLAQAEDEQDKDADDGDSDDGDATFQASFERELAALKARGPTTERPLCNVHTKLECVVMFRAAPSVNVVDLVLRILRDIQQTKTAKTRYVAACLDPSIPGHPPRR